ncbi:MAG: hypothetical protein EAZ29_06000, partial [Runella slithyformis]
MKTKPELTGDQIDALFDFVARKNVKYYDLQVELVDHLASEIERKQSEKPNIYFEQALQQVYEGFGVFGFEDFVSNAHRQLLIKQRKKWWCYFKAFWTLPKIFLSLAFFGFVFSCFAAFPYQSVVRANGVLFLGYGAFWMYNFFRNRPKIELLS